MTNEIAISVENLKRFYGKFEAVSGIIFNVKRGSIFGFLGPNGAGKTTTLYVLTGLLKPHAGSIRVLGLDPENDGNKLRSRIGCLLEEPGIYDTMTLHENLLFFGKAQNMDERKIRERIKDELEFFSLSDYSKKRCATLSKGMRQKAALARAMLCEPEILFLDEPTANLDPVSSAGFRDLILELARKRGTTVFLNTHRLDESQRVCDSVAIIKSGKILACGTVEELRKNSGKHSVVVTAKNISKENALKAPGNLGKLSRTDGDFLYYELHSEEKIPALIQKLVADGALIYEVRQEKLSLEDIFIELVEENNVA